MGVAIYWAPASDKWHHTDGGSRHADALRRTFGNDRILTSGDIATLKGMGAMDPDSTIFTDLIEAIDKCAAIRIKMEY